MVVAAEDGLDELSISARTRVIEVADGGTEEWFVEPGEFGLDEAELEQVAGGSPEENAAASRAVLEGEAGPAPRPRPAQRRRRDLRRRPRRQPRRGRRAGRRDDRQRRRARRCSSAWSRRPPRSPATRLATSRGNDRAADRRCARQGWRSAAARLPRPTSSRGFRSAASDRPFNEALVRPGLSVIAEFKRRSPSAGDISADGDGRRAGRRLRARRGSGALGAHRRAPLRRLARRPARGPRRLRPADPAQGLHRRPLPALRGGGARRRRGAADRPRARRPRAAGAVRGGARPRPRLPGRGPRRRASWSGRSSSTPT